MPNAPLSPAAVVAAAARLADAAGYDAVTVSAVARELGVRPASMYSHVRDRDALLAGVHRLALGELAERIADQVAGRSGHDALAGLALAHRRYAADRPGAWTALQRPAADETAASPEAARVASLLAAVIRGYAVPDGATVDAVRLVGATIAGFVALTDAQAFAHRPDAVDGSWAAAVDALDRALASWPQEGPAA
ncbi:TetR/AcrR family transcriptional regulator [Demequina iriomotensis]|uniref:TetR/AcrR family transcriptional regulator n=1 Tax=Demequina iriomotensis TaxID=1536641 RepID=UPI000785FEAB|nr:TetR/AcrR family transcriptional regulator [Demequina iriomotensis]